MTSVTTVLSPTPRPLYSLKRTVICVKSNAPPPTIRLFLPSYPPSVRVSFLFFFLSPLPFLICSSSPPSARAVCGRVHRAGLSPPPSILRHVMTSTRAYDPFFLGSRFILILFAFVKMLYIRLTPCHTVLCPSLDKAVTNCSTYRLQTKCLGERRDWLDELRAKSFADILLRRIHRPAVRRGTKPDVVPCQRVWTSR